MKPVLYLTIFLGLMSLWTVQNAEASFTVYQACWNNECAYGGSRGEATERVVGKNQAKGPWESVDTDNNGLWGNQFCGDSTQLRTRTWSSHGEWGVEFDASGGGEDWCFQQGRVLTFSWSVPSVGTCNDGEEVDEDTGACLEPEPEIECGAGQVPNSDGTACECENPDMVIGAGGECVPNCPVYQQWNQDLQRCDFPCEELAGRTFSCSAPNPVSEGCSVGCQVTGAGGIEVELLGSGVKTRTYKYTGIYCPDADPFETLCDLQGQGDNQEPGHDDDGPIIDEGGPCSGDLCTDADGDSGEIGGEPFITPGIGGAECIQGPGNVIACSGGQAEDGDGAIRRDDDNDGDVSGADDSEIVIADRVGGNVPEGATIVGADGRQVGKARDCDGDGVTDGIDTTGDGLCDTTSPDGAPDGDGGGGGGDCDPETEDCSDQPPGSVAGGGQCEEPPECVPSDDPDSALRCAMVNMQWKISCQFYVDTDELKGGNSLAEDKPEDSGDFLWLDEEDLEEEIPAIETDIVNWGNECPNDLEFDAFGEQYAIGVSDWCGWLSQAGAFLVIMSLMLGGRIIYAVIF